MQVSEKKFRILNYATKQGLHPCRAAKSRACADPSAAATYSYEIVCAFRIGKLLDDTLRNSAHHFGFDISYRERITKQCREKRLTLPPGKKRSRVTGKVSFRGLDEQGEEWPESPFLSPRGD